MRRAPNQFSRRDFFRTLAVGSAGLKLSPHSRAESTVSDCPEFVIGLVADVQYAHAPSSGTRHYRQSLSKLEECVHKLNGKAVAFTIQLGDFIDRDWASFDRVLAIYNRLQMPHYHVLGNHDFQVEKEDKRRVFKKLGLEQGYYDFTHRSWRVVVLDGNDVGFVANTKDARRYTEEGAAIDPARYREAAAWVESLKRQNLPNAHPYNGAIGRVQLAWLNWTLAKATQAGERVIVCCHFPVVPTPFALNLWNDLEVIQTLETHDCVAAYLCGHHHEGNYAFRNGIHYLTLPGMVETADTNAYGLLEVYPDRLQLNGYGRVPSRIMRLGQ